MLNCGKCGASVMETAIYCSSCGYQITALATPVAAKFDSPLTKAASALAKASGLTKSQSPSRFGFLVRSLSVVAGVVLAFGAYVVYRNQSSAGNIPALNIIAPLDKFNRLVQSGKRSAEQGDLKTAITNFEEAEKLVPNDTDVIKKLADFYSKDGQVDNAVTKYSRIVELDPKNVEARYQRAELQLTRGLWKEASEDLQYLAINAAHTEQGNLARQILGGNFTVKRTLEALAEKNSLARRNKRETELPTVADVPPQLALAFPQLVNGVPVVPPAPSASLDEHNNGRLLARQHKEKGRSMLGSKLYYSAIPELQSARKLAPEDADLNYLLGQAYDGLKQYTQARKFYEQCNGGVYELVARGAAELAKKNEQKQAKKARKEEKTDD